MAAKSKWRGNELGWRAKVLWKFEFGGKNSERENEIVEVAEFIGVKSYKAKGKRLTNYQVEKISELEPTVKDEDDHEPILDEENGEKKTLPFEDIPFEIDRGKPTDDENSNQMSLF